ncbi:carbon monoxide dehydrogenase subunit G [Curvibacter sp. HBC61]|uniref:Carbon monoxide dehydrogenase subunit G n=1 Tax=Curvibacter cyanobacteriorum TaxID=3026422 RepID=A0ABT5N3X5_9BURK|nr:carbon monoxide dehydrogenase subunit G [Curvibacter sp. HBC61]MDD0840782.1 carbon monoxide dehydrogenase subunit G [Curvibacter sp. HBC61]
MEMQGSRLLAITQQQAWDALNDPEVLKLCIPGCDKVEPTGEQQYAVGMALKIGPVSAKFSGKITLSDIVPPESYTIAFDGQGGVAGFGKGQAQVKLSPQAGGCELAYSVQAQVGGKIAQLGQRLIDGAAKGMAEDFFKRFDDEMQRRYPAPEAAPDVVAAEAEAAPAEGAAAAGAAPTTAGAGGAAPSAGSGVPVWAWVAGAAVLAGLLLYLS